MRTPTNKWLVLLAITDTLNNLNILTLPGVSGAEVGVKDIDVDSNMDMQGDIDAEMLPLPSYHFGAGIAVECMERDV